MVYHMTKSADGYKDAFYELCRLTRIACTIPITTASAKKKRIETYLSTTMSDEQRCCRLTRVSRRAKNLDL